MSISPRIESFCEKWSDVLTMRMNGDQKRRARKMVAVSSGWGAPARSGALCAALEPLSKMAQDGVK